MSKSSKSPMSKLNDRYAVLLAVLTLLSAVPVASSRPSWWLLWAMVIAVLGLYWLWQATRLAPHRMMQSRRYARYLMVAATVPLYAVLQALPLPSFLPSPALREGLSGFAPPAISMLPSASWISRLNSPKIAWWLLA